jgi:hypothetical protein
MADVVEKARAEADQSPEVVAAADKVNEAAKAFAADRTNKDLAKALDDAVHAHATAMSDALIVALMKVEGGRRRKTRRGRKVRRTRKSRR